MACLAADLLPLLSKIQNRNVDVLCRQLQFFILWICVWSQNSQVPYSKGMGQVKHLVCIGVVPAITSKRFSSGK